MSPRVGFVIGGVQKGGTTALARFLGRHPGVALPANKEAHVFDSPGFDDRWTPSEIDARYSRHFAEPADSMRCHGDATPIYLFHPLLVKRVARYNPAMRWIVILRHPVERAVSHYQMERSRGEERWPFWAAMLLEGWRLRDQRDNLAAGSPLRRFSYRARGDYATQLDALYASFPRDQVLVLRNEELSRAPHEIMARVHRFLGLTEVPLQGDGAERVFEGRYARLRRGSLGWRLLCWLMRHDIEAARQRHGIDWDRPPASEALSR